MDLVLKNVIMVQLSMYLTFLDYVPLNQEMPKLRVNSSHMLFLIHVDFFFFFVNVSQSACVN